MHLLKRGWILGFLLMALPSAPQADPTKISGPESCIDCHQAAHQALELMKHQTNFKDLHTSDRAKEILGKMELRSAKREFCADCHYTLQQAEGSRRARAIAGVSCESCHGAAADWLDLHNNYGLDASGTKATAATETAEHRQQRLDETGQLGMIRPDQVYQLAQNCYQCHTVPNEALVNQGGHPAGSDFELVSWLQGEVRHNFQQSADATNREAARDYDPANRRRLLYVMGQLLDLEYALRGKAAASGDGAYSQAMTARAQQAREKLGAIQGAVAALAPLLGPAIDGSVEAVQKAAQDLEAQHDGSQLGGVDALITQAPKGTPYTP